MADEILIAGASDPGLLAKPWDKLDLDVLRGNLTEFVKKLHGIVPSDVTPGGYRLQTFEVAVAINASGEVGLFGTGVAVGGEASLTLTFSCA